MADLNSVVAQLRQERSRVQQDLDRLDRALQALGTHNVGSSQSTGSRGGGKRTMSAEARARIAAAQRARWARQKGTSGRAARSLSGGSAKKGKGKRTMSAEARERIAAAQRARWARVRAAGR